MELWEIFDELLKKRGVKIADVANATGLPYTTVDSIIKKKLKDIKFSTAKKIADYFGVDAEYLYYGPRSENESSYLNDPEAMKYLEELHKRPEMKVLFDASRKASKRDIEATVAIIEALKKQSRGEE